MNNNTSRFLNSTLIGETLSIRAADILANGRSRANYRTEDLMLKAVKFLNIQWLIQKGFYGVIRVPLKQLELHFLTWQKKNVEELDLDLAIVIQSFDFLIVVD
jgi:hypothetical protein